MREKKKYDQICNIFESKTLIFIVFLITNTLLT